MGLARRRPGLEQPRLGELAVHVAGVDALTGERGRREQIGPDDGLRQGERLPGLERFAGEALLAVQLLEALPHRALPGRLGDRGETLVARPALDQGAAADDLGDTARRRLAQRLLASPRRIDRESDDASGELPAALAFEECPGQARTHAEAHDAARQPVAAVVVAALDDEADGRVGRLGGRALHATQHGLATLQGREGLGLAGAQPDLGVRAADVEAAVVVGAGDGADGRGHRLAPVLLGEPRDQCRRGGCELGAHLVLELGRATVARLPQREQQQELLVVLDPQVGDHRHGVGEGVREALAAQVVDELEQVEAQLRDRLVLGRVQAPHEHVHVDGFGRKVGADLFADREVGVVGELERAADRVVVGQRDVCHAARLGLAVDQMGIGEALAHAEVARQIQVGA